MAAVNYGNDPDTRPNVWISSATIFKDEGLNRISDKQVYERYSPNILFARV